MKPFRYACDPLCLAACGLYLFNRLWLRAHWGGAFLQGHFNDLLVIPAALPWVLWLHARLGWRDAVAMPGAGEIVFHVAVWSLVCEGLGPYFSSPVVGDPLDVLCYAAGGVLAWAWWHPVRSARRAFRHEL